MAEPQRFECKECDRVFASEQALSQHNTDRHGSVAAQGTSKLSRHDRRLLKHQEKVAAAKTEALQASKAKRGKVMWYVVGVIVALAIGYGAYGLFTTPSSGSTETIPPSQTTTGAVAGLEAPRIGDHLHADYAVYVCGQRKANLPQSPGGVHTHGDGRIHIHPHSFDEEGVNANLARFFQSTNVRLTETSIQYPFEMEWKNGDECSPGQGGTLKVSVNGQEIQDFVSYVPRDGDRIEVRFG